MAITQDVFVIGEGLMERRRTTGAGTKSRFTLDVRVDPVIINLSELNLGKLPALALQKAITEGIKAISAVASPATLLKRKYADSAFKRGAAWATKRYSGGRTGSTPPAQSDRLFNDSGRLANGVFVRQNPQEGGWTVNVPANRLDPSTFGNDGAFTSMVQRLRSLVPVLSNPLGHPDVKRAIERTVQSMFTEATDKTFQSKLMLVKQAIRLVQNVGNILNG